MKVPLIGISSVTARAGGAPRPPITVTATAVAISRDAPAPAPEAVHQLTGQLRAIADAMDAHLVLPPAARPLPADEALEPVTAAVRSVLAVLAPAERQPPELAREPA